MKKENVLFIAYQFPPKGGPGVHRSINFVKYLREFGYEPIVLTINSEDNLIFNDIIDESLINSIPHGINIVRTNSAIPHKTISFFRKIKIFRFIWYFFYPLFWEHSALWPFKTYSEAKRIIQKNNIKLVYTTSGPFSSMILGYLLQKKLKVKWVADLRDPYTDAYAWQFPSKLHWYFSRIMERFVFKKPDVLIVNTPEVKKIYMKRFGLKEHRIKVITNGF